MKGRSMLNSRVSKSPYRHAVEISPSATHRSPRSLNRITGDLALGVQQCRAIVGTTERGDDGTNHLLVSDSIRRTNFRSGCR